MTRLGTLALLAVLAAGCATAPPPAEVPVPAPVPVQPPTPAEPAAAPQNGPSQFIAEATAMLGQPYLYGGAAPGGFDCSGLVVYAARNSGLQLPRTAQDLMSVGTPVSREELRGGDLIFMHLAGKELHVGIALDDGHFIHAPSARGVVRIDLLDREPYSGGFLTARRLNFPDYSATGAN